jgi:hypothetical protein
MTLPEPIKRARVPGFCVLAGEGNVAEPERADASEAKPDEPRPFFRIKPVQARSMGGLVRRFLNRVFNSCAPTGGAPARSWNEIAYFHKFPHFYHIFIGFVSVKRG